MKTIRRRCCCRSRPAPSYAGRFHQPGRALPAGVPLRVGGPRRRLRYKGVTPGEAAGPDRIRHRHRGDADQIREFLALRESGRGRPESHVLVPKLHVNTGARRRRRHRRLHRAARATSTRPSFGMDFALRHPRRRRSRHRRSPFAFRARAPMGWAVQVGTVAADLMVSKTLTMLTPYARRRHRARAARRRRAACSPRRRSTRGAFSPA